MSRVHGLSEAELRAQAHTQIIVSAIEKVNVITYFRADADRASEGFNAATGVHGKLRSAGERDCIGKASGHAAVTDAEILKPDLPGDEETNRPRPCLKFRAEEAVQ